MNPAAKPDKINLFDTSENLINPATEDKQDEIITTLDDKELIGNTQADGSGAKYHITTDSSGRLHTRSFKNAAGDGRRMLVDADRHGQVDVLSMPSSVEYAYMGKQEITTFVYYGFKENKGNGWKVMRQNTADDSAWKYAYDTTETPPKDWATAWGAVNTLDYNDPPNS